MTRERKEEVILVALVLSLAAHIGVMAYAHARAMTSIADGVAKAVAHGPMRIVRNVPSPEPVKIGMVEDVTPRRDAPAMAMEGVPLVAEMGVVSAVAAEVTIPEMPAMAVPKDEMPSFDVHPISLDSLVSSARIPMRSIETPSAKEVGHSPPSAATLLPIATSAPADIALPAIGMDQDSMFLPSGIARVWMKKTVSGSGQEPSPRFKPTEEVFSKVDEKVVEEEKRAVKTLVDAVDAEKLEQFVKVGIEAMTTGQWTYFKVRMVPLATLEVVPKDVVVILDASGSIGKDRMVSIRNAAKRILRSATNSDDRFNLVAFRNRFSYAFRSWQGCDRMSFDRADQWLGNLAAHGRTDVFSTISSVLTLPRTPSRPLIALVVTDGEANVGVSDTAEILSQFTKLNDGLISVYMYGVKSAANRELIDVLTHGNRGESFIFDGWRWSAGDGIEKFSDRFRDPVISDIRIVFSSATPAETYPRLLKNIYRGETLSFVGRVPAGTMVVAFAIQGLNGSRSHEGFFRLPLDTATGFAGLEDEWHAERVLDQKLGTR